ncbi:MAG: type II toxin-antitoxin system HipA family toxin [Acidobacteriaceae bacterium]
MADLLSVSLHGRRIGTLRRYNGTTHEFIFAPDYIEDEHRPTLSLGFKGQRGGLVRVPPASQRLPVFFSNLLPEGHLRRYLAEKAGVKEHREFALLAALGEDLPGAVTVQSATSEIDTSTAETPSKPQTEDGATLRYSLAGVQLKFSSILETKGGLTVPAHGVGGSWIVKMPSTQIPHIPENEFLMLSLARAVGFDVPESKLVKINEIAGIPEGLGDFEGQALAVRRFDRAENGRIHMEDFAQIFGRYPNDKYEGRSYANIAVVLMAEVGEACVAEFIRRVAFTVLIGNGDMHLKNWSLIYPDKRTPDLSPVYDFVSTIPYVAGDQLGLSFGGSKSLEAITLDQIRTFADKTGLATSMVIKEVVETTEKTFSAWQYLPEKDVLPKDIREKIDSQIQKVAATATAYRRNNAAQLGAG